MWRRHIAYLGASLTLCGSLLLYLCVVSYVLGFQSSAQSFNFCRSFAALRLHPGGPVAAVLLALHVSQAFNNVHQSFPFTISFTPNCCVERIAPAYRVYRTR